MSMWCVISVLLAVMLLGCGGGERPEGLTQNQKASRSGVELGDRGRPEGLTQNQKASHEGTDAARGGVDAGRHDRDKELRRRVRAYWDLVDTEGWSEEVQEQHLVDWLYLVGHLDREGRGEVWEGFFRRVKGHPVRMVVEYLGEWDSPLYSPELLEEYLEAVSEHADDEWGAARAEYMLGNLRKNPVGGEISDLRVVTAGGSETTLRRLVAQAGGECVVVLYDPDCGGCEEWFEGMRATEGMRAEALTQDQNELRAGDGSPGRTKVLLTGEGGDGSSSKGKRVIAVSVTGKVMEIDGVWISVGVVDEDELEAGYYYSSLPSVYMVSGGLVRSRRVF